MQAGKSRSKANTTAREAVRELIVLFIKFSPEGCRFVVRIVQRSPVGLSYHRCPLRLGLHQLALPLIPLQPLRSLQVFPYADARTKKHEGC